MSTYDPPYKSLFLVCYSTVAAIVTTETSLLVNSDFFAANQSFGSFDGYDNYLEDNKLHPWCGTERLYDGEYGYLVPDGDAGVQNNETLKEHQRLNSQRLEET